MKQLSDKDKEIYLTAFHDLLIWEINSLEDQYDDLDMWAYQISILEKADSDKFKEKIEELQLVKKQLDKEGEDKKGKIELLKEELSVYEKELHRIVKKNQAENKIAVK